MTPDRPTPAVGHMPFEGFKSCAVWGLPARIDRLTREHQLSGYTERHNGVFAARSARETEEIRRFRERRFRAMSRLSENYWSIIDWTVCGQLVSARKNGLCETRPINGLSVQLEWRLTSAGQAWMESYVRDLRQ